MGQRKKLKLKKKTTKIIKVFVGILIIFLIIFGYYKNSINSLRRIGYSEKASQIIIKKFKKKEVLEIGKNKTLNKAFESPYYKEKYFHNYAKIKYQNHSNLIKNINDLIKKGYSNEQISMILSHGNSKDCEEFAKREKIKYLEEFYTIKYAKLKNYDRYVSYMEESRNDEEVSVLHVNLSLDKEAYQDVRIIKDFSYTMLVNKHFGLNKNFKPKNLVTISTKYAKGKGIKANKEAVDAAKKMIDDAKKEGYNLIINSAYRSYEDQDDIVNEYRNLYGDEYIAKYVLLAGFSEHQTGLGFDFGSTDTNIFVNSDEYTYLEKNCYKYGFIQRFKKKYEDITEISNEPWHYRYVGVEIATKIYNEDISFEEYYAKNIDK